MFFDINTDTVISDLNKIDASIDALNNILNSIETNVSSGWDSERSSSIIPPKLEEIRNSITNMRACTQNVRSNVLQYVTNVKSADEAGNITNGE